MQRNYFHDCNILWSRNILFREKSDFLWRPTWVIHVINSMTPNPVLAIMETEDDIKVCCIVFMINYVDSSSIVEVEAEPHR